MSPSGLWHLLWEQDIEGSNPSIPNMKCDYGCGQDAPFLLRNGKHCCSPNWNRCPVNRKKNSAGVTKAHKEGKMKGFTDEDRNKSKESNTVRRKQEALVNFRKGNPLSSSYLRYNLEHTFHHELRCAVCGLTEWQDKPIPLEVHHKDGDSTNNEISNLEFICLNCHAQTENYRGRNIRNVQKVSDEELLEALENTGNIRQALLEVGLSPRGGNYSRAYQLLSKKDSLK